MESFDFASCLQARRLVGYTGFHFISICMCCPTLDAGHVLNPDPCPRWNWATPGAVNSRSAWFPMTTSRPVL